MANPTSNFGWQMPTPTDLVTDLPADFEVFGQAVDTSMADLKGGTTGQVLSKNSNTDMDFVWVTNADGDITGVTAGTGITGGGTSGAVTVSFDQANFGGGQFAAGKNKIINGDFSIWQRGNPPQPTGSDTYTADRWFQNSGNNTDNYITRQAFTPGTAPVAGYEGQFYLRWVTTPAGSGGTFKNLQQRIENVETFAGQTVTLSFWAKADASRDVVTSLVQNFGSGGSSAVSITGATHTLTTSWARYSVTMSVPSISGKTIGTSSYLRTNFALPLNTAMTIEFWGVQLEAGSTATLFQTATGTIQGELAACQRYFNRFSSADNAYNNFSTGNVRQTGAGANSYFNFFFPVQMRIAPTAVTLANITSCRIQQGATDSTVTAGLFDGATTKNGTIVAQATIATAGSGTLAANNSTAVTIDWSAEL
jgi:hypothetical protein